MGRQWRRGARSSGGEWRATGVLARRGLGQGMQRGQVEWRGWLVMAMVAPVGPGGAREGRRGRLGLEWRVMMQMAGDRVGRRMLRGPAAVRVWVRVAVWVRLRVHRQSSSPRLCRAVAGARSSR